MATGKRFLTSLISVAAALAVLSLEVAIAAPINKHDAAVVAEWERLVEREARIKRAVSNAMERARKRTAAAIATTKLGKRGTAEIGRCKSRVRERYSSTPRLMSGALKDCEDLTSTVHASKWIVYEKPKFSKLSTGVCLTFFDEELKAIREKYGKSVEPQMIEEVTSRCAR